ncbi:MAG: response regulator [Elusimicrobia bacterium]|nr:response regulator [Elusimicrobiota bacterium]
MQKLLNQNIKKILVVEDDELINNTIVDCLKVEGFNTDYTDDAEKALWLINYNAYDLVITDLKLPGLSGMDIVKAVKKKDPSCRTIIITAYGTIDSQVEAIKAGAEDFIIKPFNIEEFTAKIAGCMKKPAKTVPGDENRKKNILKKTKEKTGELVLYTNLNILMEYACDLLEAQGGSLLLNKEGFLEVKAVSDAFRDDLLGKKVSPEGGIFCEVIKAGKPLLITEDINNVFFNGFRESAKVNSCICIPISDKDRCFGLLNLCRTGENYFNSEDLEVAGYFSDNILTAIRASEAEAELEKAKNSLEISSRQLEAFTKAAANDLQEPLRRVVSFLQLIETRYKDKLDASGSEFIEYAVSGAKLMKTMVERLLEYSKLGRKDSPTEEVDFNAVLDQVKSMFGPEIKAAEAEVVADVLPVMELNRADIHHLFKHLLSNSINFRGDEKLEITVSAMDNGKEWYFCVKDNGMGFNMKDKEKIFGMFNRLYEQKILSQTGMGLAICKKIIENAGGKIWAESVIGEGTSIYFTIPHKK